MVDLNEEKKDMLYDDIINLVKTSNAPVPWSYEFRQMITGDYFTSSHSREMQSHRMHIKRLLADLNAELLFLPEFATIESLQDKRIADAQLMLGAIGPGTNIVPPFWCQWGCNVFLGEGVYINRDAQFHDDAPITIGSRTIIGPSVILCTSTHETELFPTTPTMPPTPLVGSGCLTRSQPYALPIIIEEEVWICARVTINPGVRIGRGSVVASGSVVTSDVEAGVLVAGVPAKVIRKLNGEEAGSPVNME